VAAGSVVTKHVPSCTIWGGNPAQFIRSRFATEDHRLLHLAWMDARYGLARA
jgi:acetyltransferase-like isoleucine patch superfamily enzyme